MNMIINKFGSFIKDDATIQNFKEAMRNNNIAAACDVLFNVPYLNMRKFVVYLLELRDQEREKVQEKELIRDKAA